MTKKPYSNFRCAGQASLSIASCQGSSRRPTLQSIQFVRSERRRVYRVIGNLYSMSPIRQLNPVFLVRKVRTSTTRLTGWPVFLMRNLG